MVSGSLGDLQSKSHHAHDPLRRCHQFSDGRYGSVEPDLDLLAYRRFHALGLARSHGAIVAPHSEQDRTFAPPWIGKAVGVPS